MIEQTKTGRTTRTEHLAPQNRRNCLSHGKQRFPGRIRRVLFVMCCVVLSMCLCVSLTCCGGGSGEGGGNGGSGGAEGGKYEVPEFRDSAFHEDGAEGNDQVKVDLSAVSQGYVGVAATSGSRMKFQVIKDDQTYNYDIASDGKPSVFPLQLGDGTYTFKAMQNVVDSKYMEVYSASADVSLDSEYEPFLRPSAYVNYTKDSACVKKAAEISEKAVSAMDVVSGVYDYICDNVTYDEKKAKTVQAGYMPDPDETLTTGKGICFDYASLAAAMLRSQGIPAKVIFGYVAPDNLYHAWNMFYTEETGWVTVDYEVDKDSWNRLDLTFAANGADSDFIGDGSHYSDVYIY